MSHYKQEIISDFEDHIKKSGSRYYNEWYVGVTEDVESRLFDDHNVSRNNHWWIYRKATSASVAREVEQHFLDKGTDGGAGGGDEDATFVYGYKKEAITHP